MKTLKAIPGRLRRHGLRAVGVAVVVTAVVGLLEVTGFAPLQASDRAGYDSALTRYVRRTEPSKDVVVIAIDDKTLRWAAEGERRAVWGPWPFPRIVWGRLAEYLARRGARGVMFDVTMSDPQHGNQTQEMAEAIRTARLPVYLGFAAAAGEPMLPRVDAQNVFPAEVYPTEEDEAAAPTEEDPSMFALDFEDLPAPVATAPSVEEVARALAFPVEGSRAPALLDAGGVAVQPVAPDAHLIGQLPGYGLVEPEEDKDGVLRRTRFAYRLGDNDYVTLPVSMAADLFGARSLVMERRSVTLADRTWRTSPDGTVRLDYGGAPEAMFVTLPLFTVFEDAANEEAGHPSQLDEDFRGKVVVVGGSAMALQDVKATPFSSKTPGYAKQAAVLDGLLSGRFIVDAPSWLALLVTLSVALFSALLLTALRMAVMDVAWPALLYVGFDAVPGFSMAWTGVYVPWAMPVWAGILASVSSVALARLWSDRNRELLRRSFERYLEPSLVQQLVDSAQLPRLEGEVREITAFFSDIRGFSTFSERLKDDPQTLVRVLNTYLTRVSTVLQREGGCLDKYIGDAVVCLFGAPVWQKDHALRACKGALMAQKEVAKLREELRAQGLPDVYTRIGLNSGRMFVGNFGSDQLFDYTAIGDGMNLAARLEGANKAYATLIMMGPLTYEQAKDHIEARELDRVRVAGKTEPAAVYELLCMKGELSEQKRQVVTLYAQGLALFREARFSDAAAVFAQALAVDPADGPSGVLHARCLRYAASPPEGFDGVADLEK